MNEGKLVPDVYVGLEFRIFCVLQHSGEQRELRRLLRSRDSARSHKCEVERRFRLPVPETVAIQTVPRLKGLQAVHAEKVPHVVVEPFQMQFQLIGVCESLATGFNRTNSQSMLCDHVV